MRRMMMVVTALGFLLVAGGLQASVEGAKAAFMNGMTKEKAKDYKGAIEAYEQSLKEYPGYAYANKQIGNCYYYLGDKANALKNYDTYLAFKKDDASTKAFADKLRASMGTAAPAAEAAETGATPGKIQMNNSFYIEPRLAYLMNSGSDISDFYSGMSPAPTVASYALSFDLSGGYQMANGFAVGVGYEYLARVATATLGIASVAYGITESTLFVEPAYRFPLSKKLGLLGGLKVGMASASMTATITGASGVFPTATGSGLMYEPEVGIQFMAGKHVGLNLTLGYRLDSISPMTFAGASGPIQVSGSNWALNDGGIKISFGSQIYFSRLIAE